MKLYLSQQFDDLIFCIRLILHDFESNNLASLQTFGFRYATVAASTKNLYNFISLKKPLS